MTGPIASRREPTAYGREVGVGACPTYTNKRAVAHYRPCSPPRPRQPRYVLEPSTVQGDVRPAQPISCFRLGARCGTACVRRGLRAREGESPRRSTTPSAVLIRMASLSICVSRLVGRASGVGGRRAPGDTFAGGGHGCFARPGHPPPPPFRRGGTKHYYCADLYCAHWRVRRRVRVA